MCMGHVYVRTSVRTIECKQLSAKSKTLKAERCVELETVQRWVSTISNTADRLVFGLQPTIHLQ